MEYLHRRAQQVEDLFFLEQDRRLIEELRKLKHMERSRKALADVSGIQDPAILDKLIELEISPELLATLAVAPLVEVAWADDQVHDDERKAILKAAEKNGIAAGSVDHILLEQWLTHRPSPRLLEAWAHYITGLCEKLTDEQREELRKDFVTRARSVADAAGGFLGLTSRISAAEEGVIARMEKAFGPT
jgi:hypothetical protein